MQNNILTLHISKLDTFVVKSAEISTILCLFVQKIKNVRIAMVTVTQSEPVFCVDIIQNISCINNACLEMKARGFCMRVFLVYVYIQHRLRTESGRVFC